MIRINLLPRKPRRRVLRYNMYVAILVTVANFAILGGLYFTNMRHIEAYSRMIASAKKEIASLDGVYAEYLKLERQKKEIGGKINAIGGLKGGRALAARTLYDLTSVVSESLWLKTFKKTQNRFEMEGRSPENESISSFMESLSGIPYMTNVELKNIEDVTEEGVVIKRFVIQGNIGI